MVHIFFYRCIFLVNYKLKEKMTKAQIIKWINNKRKNNIRRGLKKADFKTKFKT